MERELSEPPEDVPTWESQGCPVCRRQWETSERPELIAENVADHSELYRCAVCRTLWLLTERAAVAVRADEVRAAYPELGDADHGTDSPARLTGGAAQYWRWTVGSGRRYFKFVDGRDQVLDGDHWVPYDRYRSGPSWWRLTGEADADIIDAGELPPGAPR